MNDQNRRSALQVAADAKRPARNNTGNAANGARIAGGKRIPLFISQCLMELICHSVGVSSLRLQA